MDRCAMRTGVDRNRRHTVHFLFLAHVPCLQMVIPQVDGVRGTTHWRDPITGPLPLRPHCLLRPHVLIDIPIDRSTTAALCHLGFLGCLELMVPQGNISDKMCES